MSSTSRWNHVETNDNHSTDRFPTGQLQKPPYTPYLSGSVPANQAGTLPPSHAVHLDEEDPAFSPFCEHSNVVPFKALTHGPASDGNSRWGIYTC